MTSRRSTTSPQAQQGAAALIMLIILVLGASYLLVSALNRSSSQTERDKITAAALAQAKEALIGYAAADPNRPGELPCPDVTNDGNSLPVDDYTGSACKNLVGRLPWKTLRLPDLRDGYGEHLWYTLSNAFHANGSATLNSGTTGALTVVGSYSANGVVAIVFAPGPALDAQPRDVSNENNLANYLEGENANGDNIFSAGPSTPLFNDQLLPISHGDLFRAVERRVAAEIRPGLTAYRQANGTYPPALTSIVTSLPAWFDPDWTADTLYTPSGQNLATIGFHGCPTATFTITWNAGTNQSDMQGNGPC